MNALRGPLGLLLAAVVIIAAALAALPVLFLLSRLMPAQSAQLA